MNRRIIQLVAIGFSSSALISCGSLSTQEDANSGMPPVEDRSDIDGIDSGNFTGSSLGDPSSLLSNRVVYFDFDQSDINPEYREIIEAHARYLTDNANVRVTLAGHCDERGTREYNLALGERRANTISRLMNMLGASDNQLETISYGEEQPAVLGHNESAWRENRRVEITYPK
uniref:Peptidoglycan-associated lipoprotein n=1 Tax=Candidatus Kentrum eta TaxID=2126337 RepID=A0A450VJY9_9GAMM|nr:MAG: peptidoglycan-associated lipoprotein [Candidatus Kentron sp. H]VFK01525.1 MAG: peptidoglycan-associated lipoprotein [Candidatus Kentron sp. H]VFK05061.1 MAG: peptidoglycan-associated lipoprotein [Candidatus Kentron sp. H]